MKKPTKRTYFSPEASQEFMSCSQFKAFQKCEAAALAEINGEYTRPKTTALLVGSYVDSYFEGTLEQFKAENPEVFKKDGSLKAEYLHAEKIIRRIASDRLFMLLLSGRKQVIKVGTIAGVPFKIKMDCLLTEKRCQKIQSIFPETKAALEFAEGAIIDLKIVRDFAPLYSEEYGMKVSFIKYWGYDLQGAIYREIDNRLLPFVIAGATKEEEPDLGAFYVPHAEMNAKLREVETLAPRYQAIKEGKIEPVRCECCEWCRSTKKLHTIIDYREV